MSKTVFLRAPYNYDMDKVSAETGLVCLDASLTQQQFREETDINTIVDRFMRTGELPEGAVSVPQYAEYEGVYDFMSAMNAIRSAEENFMAMPAAMRARFHNSPQEFLEFFGDPANQDEAIRLGLAVKVPDKPAVEVPVPPKAETPA